MSLHYSQTGYPDGTQVDCLSTLQIFTILKLHLMHTGGSPQVSNLQIYTILKLAFQDYKIYLRVSNLQIYTILKLVLEQ